jgi:glycosyltransferase involved in cell wall biosynthesis
MKIVFQHFSRDDSVGGAGNIATLVRTVVRENPDDRFVFVVSETSQYHPMTDCPHVEFIRIPRSGSLEYQRLKLLVRRMPRIVREVRPDVVWSINLGPYVRTGVPQVVSMHNAFQVYPRDIVQYHPGGNLRVTTMRWFTRRSLRMSDAAVVQTELMRKCVAGIPGAPQRILVASKAAGPSGSAPPIPLPERLAKLLAGDRKTFTFLYLANAVRHKNHKTIIEAIDAMPADGNIRLALSVTRDELVAMAGETASRLIDAGRIVPLGVVAIPELRATYDACDACVMPSLLESLSSAHLEAMTWGKPQVAADLPYAHDLCGEAAVYAAPTDPADWAAKMLAVAAEPALRDRLVAAGRERMAEFPCTWSEVARRVRDFLGEVAGK